MQATIEVLRNEVKQYIDQSDENLVRALHAMLIADKENNWWDDITDQQKASIDRGIRDMEEGRVIPHKEMTAFYSKWLLK